MTKTAAIFASTAILLGGCHPSQRSDTWRKVTKVPHPAREAGDADRVFAADLHRLLLESHVPHKVVTTEFSYQSAYTGTTNASRTVVVYEDATGRGSGWWLADERRSTPLWLPDQPLDRQIAFYLGRTATITNVSDFTSGDAAKMILPPDTGAPRKSAVTKIQRVEPAPPIAPAKKGAAATHPAAPVPASTKPATAVHTAESKITPATTKPAKNLAPATKADAKPAVLVEPKHEGKSKPLGEPAKKPTEKPVEKPKAALVPAAPADKGHAKSTPVATEPPPKKGPAHPASKSSDQPAAPKNASHPKAGPTHGVQLVQPDDSKNGDQPKPAGDASTLPVPADPTKKPAENPGDKHSAKPATKAEPSGKATDKPKLIDSANPAEKPAEKPADKSEAKPSDKSEAKPEEKKEAKSADKPAEAPKSAHAAKPAVKAAPNGKPGAKPDLFDKADPTPQATIIEETPAKPKKKEDPSEKSKKDDSKKDDSAEKRKKGEPADPLKPEASTSKPSALRRFFRSIFRV